MLKETEKIYLSLREFIVGSFLVVLFLGLCSCQSLSNISQINNTTVTPNSKKKCPNIPSGSLTNPEAINIDGQTVQKTGRISSDNDMGFLFQGKQGQKLSYSSNDNDKLCVWVYTPDNKIFSGVELPVNGTYIVHLASLEKATTFKIEMKLSNPNTETTKTSISSISQQKAVNLIQKYLEAKKEMFAPPYNRRIIAGIATEEFSQKALGAIDWLERNGAYYRYQVQKIDSVEEFVSEGNTVAIKVKITEDYTLYNSDGSIDNSSSNFRTLTVIYNMKLTNGNLKIYASKII